MADTTNIQQIAQPQLSDLDKASAAISNVQNQPGIVDTISNGLSNAGNYVTNFFNPAAHPEAAQDAVITQKAAELGVDPQALKNQMQQQQPSASVAPASATAPQVSQSNLTAADFPEQPVKPAEPNLQKGPGFDAVNEFEKGYRLQQQGLKAASDAASQAEVAKQAELDTRQKLLDKQAAESAIRQQDLVKQGDAALQNYQDVQNKIKDFKYENFWDNKTTGQKILAGISIALGGIGANMTGSHDNKAMDIINTAMDRDLNMQKLNFQKLKESGDAAQNLYSMYMNKYKNEQLASDATRASMLEASMNKLQSIASKYAAPEIQAKQQMLMGQMQQQHATQLQDLKVNAMKIQAIQQLAGGANAGEMNPAVVAMLPKEYQERVTSMGLARGPEEAKEFNKYEMDTKPLLGTLKNVIELSKNFNKFDPQKRAEIQAQLKFIAPSLVKASGANRTTETEINQLSEAIGDPTKFAQLPGTALTRMKTIFNTISKERMEKAKAAGVRIPTESIQPQRKFGQ